MIKYKFIRHIISLKILIIVAKIKYRKSSNVSYYDKVINYCC